MKINPFVFVPIAIAGMLLASPAVQAGPEGYSDTQARIERGGFNFPAPSSRILRQICAVDNYGGLWHLNVANGVIAGYRDNISDCNWSVSGSYTGAQFRMDMVLNSGTNCCTTGYANGAADRASRTASGDVYWTGNCDSGPWAYTWTLCP